MYPGQNKFYRFKKNLNKNILINENIYSEIQIY